MFDVFTVEDETLIKDGISNLYWYKGDLKKACLCSGISESLYNEVCNKKNQYNSYLSKREIMDELYLRLRNLDANKRLEISRNFVRLLVEHKDFLPQDSKHNIMQAELASIKLKEKIKNQKEDLEKKKTARQTVKSNDSYEVKREKLNDEFLKINKLEPRERGYELEKLFVELMKISNIEVVESFKNVGEQIDGAIKYNNIHYLVELKWHKAPIQQKDLASLYFKVEGKLAGTRGIFISMSGYSNEMLQSSVIGKELKVLMFDGLHFTNVISGNYTFSELMDTAIEQASLNGKIYCTQDVK